MKNAAEPGEISLLGLPWEIALDRFSAATGLSAGLYDSRAERRQGPTTPTHVHRLLTQQGLWRETGKCAAFEQTLVRECMATDSPQSVLFEGALRVAATPMRARGQPIGAFVYGWVFERFGTTLECQRLAPALGLSGHTLWTEVRNTPPTSPTRFATFGALLDAMITSNLSHAETLAELRSVALSREIFFAHVSHELRSPLAAINLRAALMLRSDLADPARVRSGLESMARAGADQERLIEDLIESARGAKAQLSMTLEPIRLGAVIERALESVQLRAAERKIELHVGREENDQLLGDPARLRQVFVNLLANAVKFTPPGGHVDVDVTRQNGGLEARVRDTGSGIDAELLPHVFEPFTQLRPGEHKGLGLGLSVARQLIALHGGTICAESAGPNLGAVFTIWLPDGAQSASGTDPSRARS